MTTVPAATPVWRRPALAAWAPLLAAFIVWIALFGGTSSARADRSSSVAAAGPCRGADDVGASLPVQQKAIVCLVNAARRRADRRTLSARPKLRRASAIKGRVVVSCGQVSHTPCGSHPAAGVRAAGYRFSWFGENLFFGTWGAFSPRQVVESWLNSPSHRANILRPSFRHLGVSRVRARGVFGESSTAIWVATFASPR